jgi:hypothetical protein
MTQWIEHFRWDFPGDSLGVIIALVAGLLVVAFSYRFTLRKTTTAAKVTLSLLRLAFMIVIIICLANPRLERTRSLKNSNHKKIAVVIDDSASMRIKGFWKKDRLQNALTCWQDKIAKGDKSYHYNFFCFAEELRSVEQLDTPPPRSKVKATKTKLYQTIEQLCNRLPDEGFAGVIYLTDAIDTSGSMPKNAISLLAASPLKHIFIPITTELPAKSHITLRKVEAPTQAFVGTEVPMLIITQQSNISPTTQVKLTVMKNDQELTSRKLHSGSGMQSIKLKLPIRSVGTDHYQAILSLNDQPHSTVPWTITKSIKKDSAKVLIYQGALDWGTRFFRYIFADNAKIKLELRYAKQIYDLKQKNISTNFPDADALANYDVIVLFNLNRRQITARMEKELQQFVKRGGGLFFLNGNPISVREFANSPLEKLLPVSFVANHNTKVRANRETADFLRKITTATRTTSWDTSFRRSREFNFRVPKLKDFIISKIGRQSPIFIAKNSSGKSKLIIPKFQDVANIKSAKPGANVLAYWLDMNTVERRIILAYQNFGKGRSMVLATDPLWRWRLATPSKDKSFEYFWENLFFWLAQGQNKRSYWAIPNLLITGGKPINIPLNLATATNEVDKIRCSITADRQKEQPLSLMSGNAADHYYIQFTPQHNQLYTLKAQYDGKVIAQIKFQTQPKSKVELEKVMLKPDMKLLQQFASLPNVYLEDAQNGFDIKKYFTTKEIILAEKETIPLWHRWWIYLIMVTFFALEMLLRRLFKLV